MSEQEHADVVGEYTEDCDWRTTAEGFHEELERVKRKAAVLTHLGDHCAEQVAALTAERDRLREDLERAQVLMEDLEEREALADNQAVTLRAQLSAQRAVVEAVRGYQVLLPKNGKAAYVAWEVVEFALRDLDTLEKGGGQA